MSVNDSARDPSISRENKTQKTSLMRAEEQNDPADIQLLPVGQVLQVYSMYCNVEHEGIYARPACWRSPILSG